MTFPPDTDFLAKTLDSLIISPVSKGLDMIKRKTIYPVGNVLNRIGTNLGLGPVGRVLKFLPNITIGICIFEIKCNEYVRFFAFYTGLM